MPLRPASPPPHAAARALPPAPPRYAAAASARTPRATVLGQNWRRQHGSAGGPAGCAARHVAYAGRGDAGPRRACALGPCGVRVCLSCRGQFVQGSHAARAQAHGGAPAARAAELGAAEKPAARDAPARPRIATSRARVRCPCSVCPAMMSMTGFTGLHEQIHRHGPSRWVGRDLW